MRIYFIWALLFTAVCTKTVAQESCGSADYQRREISNSPLLKGILEKAELLIQQQLSNGTAQRGEHLPIITIPVVVHILYNQSTENISDREVFSQIELLNQHFRRLHSDTSKTPSRFQALAADCDIEFKLAITDPRKRATTGIVRKYTPVAKWEADDKVKFSANTGDDAWDAASFLNIWVCNLNRVQGYASSPGGPLDKDGVVLNYNVFRNNRTIVHETGHWLGLRHIWGDDQCGDDMIDDTPKQSTFTMGCPTGIRLSCSNGANGDMYMNYMDLTSDVCMNLFTEGQKKRMRAVLDGSGLRSGIAVSYALQPPLISEIPLPEEDPKWFHPHLYPNPATSEITLDISYDIRWIGKYITITSVQGQPLMQLQISSKIMKISTANLKPGIYFVTGKKEDGATIKHKLVKM